MVRYILPLAVPVEFQFSRNPTLCRSHKNWTQAINWSMCSALTKRQDEVIIIIIIIEFFKVA